MKAIAKLFETMLTKDATPTWGHQTGDRSARGAGPERSWGWSGAAGTVAGVGAADRQRPPA